MIRTDANMRIHVIIALFAFVRPDLGLCAGLPRSNPEAQGVSSRASV
jgi:hypothetical protein